MNADALNDRPGTVLVVEDDTPTRMLLRAVLGRQGLSVVEASDGAAGVARFVDARPDLVLMDVMMPVMDGFEACERIRDADGDRGTPVIMLTGADDMEAIDRAFNAGATDFITKPINWPLLTQRVRYALRGSALLGEVRRNRMRQATAGRIARLGFWEWHDAEDRFEWSEDAAELIGVAPSRMANASALLDCLHRDDRERVRRALDMARRSGGRLEIEARFVGAEGERVITMIGERGGEGHDPRCLFGAFQDVTDARRTEALVDYLALHDELTGLGNRRLLIQRMREIVTELGNGGGFMLVAWVNLSRFHRINDALGEAAGDTLLNLVAQRLSLLETSGGEVARVGGDEFALVVRAEHEADARHRAEHLLLSLDYPFRMDGQDTFVSWSAGLACYPEHAADPEQLLNLAQDAQRQARAQGTLMMDARLGASRDAAESLDMERALRRALDNGEFHLVYQPQMDLRSGRIVGVESLLRWRHPERGLVSPVEFIPLLEELGLINAVGAWVLEEACRQAAAWHARGRTLRVGINLSPRQFLDPKLSSTLVGAIHAAGADPRQIELEITESLAMQDPDHAIALLRGFRELGCKVAIDDFGIGYSSLEYLLRFPLDCIKIDRAFLTRITDSQVDRAIVRAVTVIAQTMGLTTIAEGVETLRQCDFVEALGVHEVQGYLIGKPMSVDALDALMDDFRRPGAT